MVERGWAKERKRRTEKDDYSKTNNQKGAARHLRKITAIDAIIEETASCCPNKVKSAFFKSLADNSRELRWQFKELISLSKGWLQAVLDLMLISQEAEYHQLCLHDLTLPRRQELKCLESQKVHVHVTMHPHCHFVWQMSSFEQKVKNLLELWASASCIHKQRATIRLEPKHWNSKNLTDKPGDLTWYVMPSHKLSQQKCVLSASSGLKQEAEYRPKTKAIWRVVTDQRQYKGTVWNLTRWFNKFLCMQLVMLQTNVH